jgi:hypothetical protein
MTYPQFLRRDEHPTMPVIYRWIDNRVYRCSESEWRRMKDDRRTGHNSIVRGEETE